MQDQTTPVKSHASRLTSVCWFAMGVVHEADRASTVPLAGLPRDFSTRKATPTARSPNTEAANKGSEYANPSAAKLPVRRVVLYKNGVGYFEHLHRVRGSQDVHVDFTSAQLNDVLKSLTVLDLSGGRINRRGLQLGGASRTKARDAAAVTWANGRPRRSSWGPCAGPDWKFAAETGRS